MRVYNLALRSNCMLHQAEVSGRYGKFVILFIVIHLISLSRSHAIIEH